MHRTRPRFPVERDACVRAAGRLLDAPVLHAALASALKVELLPAQVAWLSVSARYTAARAGHVWAIRQEQAASKVFVCAFRRWASSVTDAEGRRAPHQLAALLRGVLPGQIPELPHAEAVNRTAWLERQAEEHPALGGDPALLAALVLARDTLLARLTARELALTAQVEARIALVAQQRLFDGAWGNVVRIIRRVAPEFENWIPVFTDRKKKAPAPEDVPEPAAAEAPKPSEEKPPPNATASPASEAPRTDPTDAPDPGIRFTRETGSGGRTGGGADDPGGPSSDASGG